MRRVRLLPELRPRPVPPRALALALALLALVAAWSCAPAHDGGEGAECFQATDCVEGLVCVARQETRVCTSDVSGLGEPPLGGGARDGGGADGGATGGDATDRGAKDGGATDGGGSASGAGPDASASRPDGRAPAPQDAALEDVVPGGGSAG